MKILRHDVARTHEEALGSTSSDLSEAEGSPFSPGAATQATGRRAVTLTSIWSGSLRSMRTSCTWELLEGLSRLCEVDGKNVHAFAQAGHGQASSRVRTSSRLKEIRCNVYSPFLKKNLSSAARNPKKATMPTTETRKIGDPPHDLCRRRRRRWPCACARPADCDASDIAQSRLTTAWRRPAIQFGNVAGKVRQCARRVEGNPGQSRRQLWAEDWFRSCRGWC